MWTQQRCSRVFGQTSPAAFQNPSAPSAMASAAGRRAPPLQVEQQIAPVLRALAGAIVKPTVPSALRRRADQHQDALLFVFEARLEMDAIGPDVDVALRRQIAPLPRAVFVSQPSFRRPMADADNPAASLRAARPAPRRSRRWRYPSGKGSAAALDRFRAAHVGRQDRRREPDAVGVGSVRLAIAYTRLADGDCRALALFCSGQQTGQSNSAPWPTARGKPPASQRVGYCPC